MGQSKIHCCEVLHSPGVKVLSWCVSNAGSIPRLLKKGLAAAFSLEALIKYLMVRIRAHPEAGLHSQGAQFCPYGAYYCCFPFSSYEGS